MPTKDGSRFLKLLPKTAAFAAVLSLTALGSLALGAGRTATPGSTTVPDGGEGTAIATCPEGTRAISGGFQAPDFAAGLGATVRISSMRIAKRNWATRAAGFGSAPEASHKIESYAYCTKDPQRVRIVKGPATVQGSNTGSAVAECRANEQAISGGFTSPDFDFKGGAHPLVLGSYRLDKRSWKIEAINVNFDDGMNTPPAGIINAFAFCRKGGPNVVTRSTDATTLPNGGGSGPQSTNVDAACPAGMRAISGGFNGHLGIDGRGDLNSSGGIGSLRLPGAAGWRIQAVSVGDAAAQMTAQALCETK